MKSQPLPLIKALLLIFVSTLLVSGSAAGALLYWRYHQAELACDDRYNIVAIIQACDSKEPLQTNYLSELLDLSLDEPTNIHNFNTSLAKEKLLSFPIIKSVDVKKIVPSMLFINYTMRRPIAYITEFANTAVDEEGVLIPCQPFYTPKIIPKVTLGEIDDLKWGDTIPNVKLALMQDLIVAAAQAEEVCGCLLKGIDISDAFSKKLGSRGIVVAFGIVQKGESASCRGTSLVRFSVDNWHQQLANYGKLHTKLSNELALLEEGSSHGVVIDMRISQLAFILKRT